MKKTIALLLVLALTVASVFAVVNNQKVYSVTDDVYSNIETLYIASGYGLPSSSGPWTGAELLLMMQKINRSSLAKGYQNIYDSVMAALNPEATLEYDTVSLDFGLEVNTEMYLRSNATNADSYIEAISDAENMAKLIENISAAATAYYGGETNVKVSTEGLNKWTAKFVNSTYFDDEEIIKMALQQQDPTSKITDAYTKFIGFGDMTYLDNLYNGSSEWFHGEDYRKPFLNATFETWAAKNFYGYFEITASDSSWKYLYQKAFNANINTFFKLNVGSNDNIPSSLKPLQRFALLSWHWPQKALASVGGDNWAFTVGRDKLSWGSGETGNLMLSKSFDVHTFAEFTTFHNNFNYTLLTTYYPYYEEAYIGLYSCGQDGDTQDGFKGLIAHRLEYSMFKNKVNLAITESVMIKKLKGDAFNLAMVNPFGFMHNEYVRTNSNSLLVLEADYTPVKNVNVYGQFALDEFSVGGGDDTATPAATGFLLGAKGTLAVGQGVFTFNAEVAKTNPYLYLRGKYGSAGCKVTYGADKIDSYGSGFDALTRFFTSSGITYTNDFITYTYGNDKVVFYTGAEYKVVDNWNAAASYTGIVSGIMNIYSPWGEYGDVKDQISSPSTTDPYWNGGEKDSEKTGVIETTSVVTLSGEYQTPVKGLSVNGLVDFIYIKNWNNKEGATFGDVQATFGVKYTL